VPTGPRPEPRGILNAGRSAPLQRLEPIVLCWWSDPQRPQYGTHKSSPGCSCSLSLPSSLALPCLVCYASSSCLLYIFTRVDLAYPATALVGVRNATQRKTSDMHSVKFRGIPLNPTWTLDAYCLTTATRSCIAFSGKQATYLFTERADPPRIQRYPQCWTLCGTAAP
jgi:hypothetical protein